MPTSLTKYQINILEYELVAHKLQYLFQNLSEGMHTRSFESYVSSICGVFSVIFRAVVLNRWSADPWGSAKRFQRVRENFEI